MNIVLIGMRGSGKTTTSKELAKKLGKYYIEMDFLITQNLGKSIPEIVKEKGWDFFRQAEHEMALEVAQLENAVISTSGGVVLREGSIDALKKNGTIFYLTAPAEVLAARVGDDPNRPALTDKTNLKDELVQVLKDRKKLYEDGADYTITTNDKTVEQVVEEIIQKL